LGGADPKLASCLLSDSSVVYLRSFALENCTDGLATIGLVRFNLDMEPIWYNDYSYLNGPCEENTSFVAAGVHPLNDSTFIAHGRWLSGNSIPGVYQVGEFFAFFNYDGDLIDLAIRVDSENGIFSLYMQHELISWNDQLIGIGSFGHTDPYIAKINYQGEIVDSLRFGNPNERNGYIRGAIMDDGHLLCVYPYTTFETPGPQSTVYQTIHVVKINLTDFSIIFDHTITSPYDGNLWQAHGFTVAYKTSNNELLIAGNRTHTTSIHEYHRFVWKLDSEGEIIWQNEYSHTGPDVDQLGFWHLLETPDGGYLGTGNVRLANNLLKCWLFKIDPCGYEEPMGCPEFVDVVESKQKIDFSAWPNPFYNELKANLPEDAILIEWLDMSGRIIHTEQVFYPKQRFNLSKLADGNYMMRVVMEDGTSLVKRVMKQ